MSGKRKVQNPYDVYRAEAYATVATRNRGRIADLDDVVDELLKITPAANVDLANRAAARLAVEAEDGFRTNPPHWEFQPSLPGWPDPENVFWKVGDGERVRVGDATAADHVAHIRMVEENERVVVDAAREARRRYYDLEPYYRGGAGSVADAAVRWQMDHP